MSFVKKEMIRDYLLKNNRRSDWEKLEVSAASAVTLGERYWLELADPEHREGKYLAKEYQVWQSQAGNHQKGLGDFFDDVERNNLIAFTKDNQYKIQLSDDACLRDAAGALFDTSNMNQSKVPGYAAIVIDMSGNVYMREHQICRWI